MKYKVAELEGAWLDAAVAEAEGLEWGIGPYRARCDGTVQVGRSDTFCYVDDGRHYAPSTSWEEAGMIIEREKIAIGPTDMTVYEWKAKVGECELAGTEPLLVAMRAYVTSKLGEEVEL